MMTKQREPTELQRLKALWRTRDTDQFARSDVYQWVLLHTVLLLGLGGLIYLGVAMLRAGPG